MHRKGGIMQFGLETALDEITLVLFTTLAPAGVAACVVMALYIACTPLAFEVRSRVAHAIAVPLVVSMVGLVASATHLGNPSNALYVFLGVGRSPLSNEVFSSVVFLAACGLYWLFSFSEKEHARIHRVWCAVIAATGILCIGGVAFAYDVRTIVSWSTPFVPANVVLSALAGGPILGMLGLRIARVAGMHATLGKALAAISVCSLAANIVCLSAQCASLGGISNGYGAADGLVPFYGWMIAVYALLAGAGALSVAVPLWRGAMPGRARFAIASALFMAGLFIVRFAFYMMHMTVGLGI